MRTRTRTDSPVGQRLDLSWDTPPTEEKEALGLNPTEGNDTPAAAANSPAEPQETPPLAEIPPQPFPAPEPPSPEKASDAPAGEAASPMVPPPEDTSPPAPPSDTEASQSPDALFPDVNAPAKDAEAPADAEEPQPGEDADSQESRPSAPAKANRRAAPPVNIIPRDERVGDVLIHARMEANVKVEDLSSRLNIDKSVIQSLENGDYESLEKTFGRDNCIYIVMFFKSISEELGLSKNEIDSLVERLYKEIRIADPDLSLDAPPSHRDEPDEVGILDANRPIKSVLPKLIVFLLIVVSLVFFFLSIIVPYVSRTRPGVQKRVDYIPFIEQPWKSPGAVPPQQIPIP